ncbi:MAG: hypothetical protein ACM3N9_04225 [Syntrophothermus sp.]
MTPVDNKILDFISEHHILTLAVSFQDRPWCATCFYVYLQEKNLFVFTSDDDTRHIRDFIASGNSMAAGAIALETKMVGNIRGIQFAGSMRKLAGQELDEAKKAYVRAFPVAMLAHLELWGLEPEEIKMTDNRFGFGKKLIWRK